MLGLKINPSNISRKLKVDIKRIKKMLLIMNQNAAIYKCQALKKLCVSHKMCFKIMEIKMEINKIRNNW